MLEKVKENDHATKDQEIEQWLVDESDQEKDLIVEAELPYYQVEVKKVSPNQSYPSNVTASPPLEERFRVLEELNDYLSQELHLRTVVLKLAGSISLRAKSKDARKILEHPLVRKLWLNQNVKYPA